MYSAMDLELMNYINLDLKWNKVKKGRRSTTRRLRKPGADAFKSGVELGNKIEDPAVFEIKPGVDVIGRHFGEKTSDAPLKKRRLLRQSPSPPPQTPCLLTPPLLHGSRATSQFKSQETKFKTGLRKSDLLEPTKKEAFGLDDFSGIELLAAAACSSFIHDNVEEEHTTPGVNLCTFDAKEAIGSTEVDGSSVKDHVVLNTNDNGVEGEEKRVAPSKGVRFHWDLNTVMDEWEEPCYESLAEPHSNENRSGDAYNDGFKSVRPNLDGAIVAVVPQICDSFKKTNELIEDSTCSREILGTKTISNKTSDDEGSVSKSDVVDSLIHPGKCDDLLTSTTSVLRDQTIIKGEPDRQLVSEVMQGYNDKKVAPEDPQSDCCGSNVTQDEQGHMAEEGTMEKVQAGYDSPFEDGELREPIGWEDNEVKKTDCVSEDEFGTVEYPLPEKIEVGCENKMEDRSSFTKEVGEKIQMVGNGRSEAVPNNGIKQGDKANTFERPNCFSGSKAFGCELNVEESNHGSGRIFSEMINGHDELRSFDVCRNGAYTRQNRFSNIGDSYSRGGKDFSPGKFTERVKASSQGRGCTDSSDSSVRICDLNHSHEYNRLKNITEDSLSKPGGSRNYNPRGFYRTFNRRPSPPVRNDTYSIHRGADRSNRSGSRRAFEEEYPDLDSCYLERKVHRFSPNFNRPTRRSRSRSRSGSPIAWNFQKRKNLDTKKQSPDESEKYSFLKPSFSSERAARFSDNRKITDKRLEIYRRNQRYEPTGYPKRS